MTQELQPDTTIARSPLRGNGRTSYQPDKSVWEAGMNATVKPLIHPQEFQWGWNLTVAEVADFLAIECRTYRGYICRPDAATHREPPKPVKRLAAALTELWIMQGKIPANPNFLLEI